MNSPFDNDKYLHLQSEKIIERINRFGGKLYMEFGGKLFDDFHASRVLPGFLPDSKLIMLSQLKDRAEIIFAINAEDIEKNKIRGDIGITYDLDVLRLIDVFRSFGFYVSSVVITRWKDSLPVRSFAQKLENIGVKYYKHYTIDGYPTKVSHIVSEDGFGRNEYVQTTRSLVVVTAPGPGSGKMAVCLSQLYHEHKRGISAGYAKYETFPVWNLPLSHPVNLAYEAATADLNDINMIDPYHFEAYNERTVNYNRDVEIFPVLDAIFTQILGSSPYKSPTDMGVNMAGFGIVDDEKVRAAARQEIIRRYFTALCRNKRGVENSEEIAKIELLLEKSGADISQRKVIAAAHEKKDATGTQCAAIELSDGTIVTGKSTALLSHTAAAVVNALKHFGQISDDILLLSPGIIKTLQRLKTDVLKNDFEQLSVKEVLTALSVCAGMNPMAEHALQQVKKLKGAELHSTVILTHGDEKALKNMGVNITSDPEYDSEKILYGI